MEVRQVIEERRAYRSLDPVEIAEDIVYELARAAQLSPSCFNKQPWRYVFVYEKDMLAKLKEALSRGNEWAQRASMIIAVFSTQDDDCVIKDRIYHQFDTGMATGFLILRATEMGLVAHPIAGYSPSKVQDILDIPDEYQVITLMVVGKHAEDIKPELSEHQVDAEGARPNRMAQGDFAFRNRYSER